uniref:LigA n=1 Tax=Parastrongyloides trichosuri TaxID=131310 RepID=A0A0N4Z1J0_PARTI
MCITWLASPWAATRSQPIIRPFRPYDPDPEVSFPPDRPARRGGGRGAGRHRPAEPEPGSAGSHRRARTKRLGHGQADPSGPAAVDRRHPAHRPVRRRPDRPDAVAARAGADRRLRRRGQPLGPDPARPADRLDRHRHRPSGERLRPAVGPARRASSGLRHPHRPGRPAGRRRPVRPGARRPDRLRPADRAERADEEPLRLSGQRQDGHHLGRRNRPIRPRRRPAGADHAERVDAALFLARGVEPAVVRPAGVRPVALRQDHRAHPLQALGPVADRPVRPDARPA